MSAYPRQSMIASSSSSAPKLRHLGALAGHLGRLSSTMAVTEGRMRDMDELLRALQLLGGGQAAKFMAVAKIVEQDLEKERLAEEAAMDTSVNGSSAPEQSSRDVSR